MRYCLTRTTKETNRLVRVTSLNERPALTGLSFDFSDEKLGHQPALALQDLVC